MRLPACLILAFFSASVQFVQSAEPDEVVRLWPNTPPGPTRDVGEEQDITKDTDRLIAGRRIIKLANVATPEAHVFLAPKDIRTGSAIIVCPGGGYSILAWDLEGTEVAEWLNSIGVTAVVLKYRVPTRSVDPKWLLPVQDAQRTISVVRSRADDLGVKEDRIGILGFSAGGHTAAKTAFATERHYQPIDKSDNASCRPDISILIYPAYLNNKEKTALAEDIVVTSDSPPTFAVHAFNDGVPAEGSLLLALALKKADVASELHMYDTGGHGYGLRPVDAHPVTTWPKPAQSWLNRIGWLDESSKPEE